MKFINIIPDVKKLLYKRSNNEVKIGKIRNSFK